MADEVAKLVTTNTKGETVSDYGYMDPDAMQQTLDLAKQYVQLDDSAAAEKLQNFILDDVRDTSFWEAVTASDGSDLGTPEKVNIVSGGGDISETTAVNNGTVDFGVTWFTNLISADAGGMNLVEVSQIFQRSGLVLVYKLDNYSK